MTSNPQVVIFTSRIKYLNITKRYEQIFESLKERVLYQELILIYWNYIATLKNEVNAEDWKFLRWRGQIVKQ